MFLPCDHLQATWPEIKNYMCKTMDASIKKQEKQDPYAHSEHEKGPRCLNFLHDLNFHKNVSFCSKNTHFNMNENNSTALLL